MDIFDACKDGNLQNVKHFLRKGIDINLKQRSFSKRTPLLIACSEGHLNIAQFLLEHGADHDARSSAGITALMIASDCGYFKIARLLFKHGANPAIKSKSGTSALEFSKSTRIKFLFHKYSHLLEEEERKLLQGRKYHCVLKKETYI